jgi:succinylglutamate desuccinylase
MNTDVFEILNYFHRHSSASIPHCIQISSPKPGDHVVIVGGTHGNEPAGVKASVQLHRAFRNGDMALERGNISFILGNPEAFQKAVRYVDNDLNRAFAGQNRFSVEGRRALEIKAFFRDNDDINAVLDLHSVSIGDFRIVVYSIDNPEILRLALKLSAIPLHFAFHPEHMPGTLLEAARLNNIGGLIVECGNHFSAYGVETARQHIFNFLVLHHLMDGGSMSPPPTPATITRYESIQAIKPHAGFTFLFKDIETGTRLKKGQKFAKDHHGYHIAPEDCYVVVPSKAVLATDVDAGFLGRLTVMTPSQSNTLSY